MKAPFILKLLITLIGSTLSILISLELFQDITRQSAFNPGEIICDLIVITASIGLIFRKIIGWIIVQTLLIAGLLQALLETYFMNKPAFPAQLFTLICFGLAIIFLNLQLTLELFNINKKQKQLAYTIILVLVLTGLYYFNFM